MSPTHRCFTVCVQYHDLLSWTISYNFHHFSEITVITTPEDTRTQDVVKDIPNASCYLTNSFYKDGALFAKYLCIEEALDAKGRHGSICLLDADILLPKHISWQYFRPDILYVPFRYMADPMPVIFPTEDRWSQYKVHRQEVEFAGYCQIFDSESPPLRDRDRWHDTSWNNCSGGDSFFQAMWPQHMKVRPTWRCLHLGPSFVNWAGRTSNYTDGTIPEGAEDKRKKLEELMHLRKVNHDFRAEKVVE
jgi:hypothetical protein